MKTLFGISLLLLLFNISSFSQNIDLDVSSDCIVWKVSGKVTYNDGSRSSWMTVTEGMSLSENAKLQVGNKASVALARDGKVYTVAKKGEVGVNAVLKGTGTAQSASTKMFIEKVALAKGYVGKPGSSDTSSSKGWGDKDTLILILPQGSKIPAKPFTFRWTPIKSATGYVLSVYRDNTGQPLLSAHANGTALSIDLGQLAVMPGQTYKASVATKDMKVKSGEVSFSVVAAADETSATASLLKDKDYQSSSNSQKLMMEAIALEGSGLFTSADERYSKALMQDAKNKMLREMYGAFLMRQNFAFAARQYFQN
jgi:hypothetical protein